MPKVKFYSDSEKTNQVYPEIDLKENLERDLANYFALTSDDGIYGVSWDLWDTSHSSSCTKYGKNEGKSITPATDIVIESSNYSKAFDTYDCNAFVDDDGVQHITYLKGMDGYGDTEDTIQPFEYNGKTYLQDVFVIKRTYYEKWYKDSTTQYYERSFIPREGFKVVSQAVAKDGTIRPWFLVAKYVTGLDSQGRRRSLKNLVPMRNASYANGVSAYHLRGNYYTGGLMSEYKDIMTTFWLKFGTRNTQSIMAGCTNYNVRYQVASDASNVSRIKIPTTNANYLVVGSSISVGDVGSHTSIGREFDYMHNIVDSARITSIVPADTTYSYVYLDCEPFTISHPDTTYCITMAWKSGFSDMVLGRDGAPGNLTNGKTPMVIDGIETMVGGFEIPGNAIMNIIDEEGTRETYVTNDATKITTNFADIQTDYDKSTYNITPEHLNVIKTEGNPIHLGGETTGLNRYIFNGKTEQFSTTGRNLYKPTVGTADLNGLTVTVAGDGKVSFSGTPTKVWSNILATELVNIPDGIYVCSIPKAVTYKIGIRFYQGEGYTDFKINAGSTSVVTSNISGITALRVYIEGLNTEASISDSFYIQVESGSTAHAYEQYTGGIASPNPDYPQVVKETEGTQYIKTYGKNLAMVYENILSTGGLTSTLNDDGTITTTGLPDANYVKITSQYSINDMLINGETYTLSQSAASQLIYLQLNRYNKLNGITYYTYLSSNASETFVADTDTYTYSIIVQSGQLTAWNNTSQTITSYYQLEKGSSATTFEKYKTQSKPVSLGKNLFKPYSYGTISVNGVDVTIDENDAITLNGTASERTYIEMYYKFGSGTNPQSTPLEHLFGDSIVLTTVYKSGSLTSSEVPYVSVQCTSGYVSSVSFTTDNRHTGVNDVTGIYRVYAVLPSGSSYTNYKFAFQIEKGTASTSFEKYKTPIRLNAIGDSKDRIYKSNNKWYLEKNIGEIMLEDINVWSVYSAGSFYSMEFNALYNGKIGDVKCNILTNSKWAWNKPGRIGISSSGNLWITTGNSSLTNTTLLADWLHSQNAVLYYQLAEPITTEIVNEEIKTQLNAFSIYSGENNICVTSTNNAKADLIVYSNANIWNYITEMELDLENGVAIPTKSGQTNSGSSVGFADGLSANDEAGVGYQREFLLLGYLLHQYFSGLTCLDACRNLTYTYWGFLSRLSINALGGNSSQE